MFCTKCGKNIPDGSAFCTYCGATIKKPSGAADPKERYQEDVYSRERSSDAREARRDYRPRDSYRDTPPSSYGRDRDGGYRSAAPKRSSVGVILAVIGAAAVLASLIWMWVNAGSDPGFYGFMVYCLPMIVIAGLALIWGLLRKFYAVLTVALMAAGYYLGSWISQFEFEEITGYSVLFMIGTAVILIAGIVGIAENKD